MLGLVSRWRRYSAHLLVQMDCTSSCTCASYHSHRLIRISSGLLDRITNRRLPPHRRRRSRCWRRRSWCPPAPCSPSSSLFSPASSLFYGFAVPVLGHDLHDSSHCRWLNFSRPSVATYSPPSVSWNRTRFLSYESTCTDDPRYRVPQFSVASCSSSSSLPRSPRWTFY